MFVTNWRAQNRRNAAIAAEPDRVCHPPPGGDLDVAWRASGDPLRPGLLRTGRIEAGKIAIGLGISGAAEPLTVLNHGRPASRLPGGAAVRFGLLFLRRQRRSGANDATVIDAEVGGLAGGKRPSGGDGRRLGSCLCSRRIRRCRGIGRVPVIHRKRRLRGRTRNTGGDKEQDSRNNTHFTSPEKKRWQRGLVASRRMLRARKASWLARPQQDALDSNDWPPRPLCIESGRRVRRLTPCPARRVPAACRNWRPSAAP